MKRAIVSVILSLVAILGTGAGAKAVPYDKLVVFGDSLSDNGNLYRATQQILPFGLAVPGSPYYNGRLSNGPLYNEYLAQSLGTSIAPAMAGGSNYAFAAAATDYYSASFLGLEQLFGFPSIIDGVIAYGEPLYNSGTVPSPNTLHIVWAGANNLLDLIDEVALVLPTNPNQASEVARNGVIGALEDIIDISLAFDFLGIEEMLMINMPDLGATPLALGSGTGLIGTAISDYFNDLMDYMTPLMTWIDVIPFDANAAMQDAIDNPANYGLTNVTDACLTGGLGYLGGGSVCSNPDGYLFWDDIHPTTVAHQFLADQIFEMLNGMGAAEPPVAISAFDENALFMADRTAGPRSLLSDFPALAFQTDPRAVPEPASAPLILTMMLGLAGLAGRHRIAAVFGKGRLTTSPRP